MPLARGQIHDQAVALTPLQLTVVFLTLGLVLFIATLDTTCVSTALPAIAADLGAGSSITWVGTSSLVASTTTQVVASRLSDIFGRKALLQASLAIFALGNVLCGLARSPAMLYAARGVGGVGGGAITSLALIVVSDVVSLRDRGKYMSFMGIPVALGLGLGPEVGGALADHASWRWAFWITVPFSLGAMPVIWWFLPLKPVPGALGDKLRAVDWAGCVLSLAGIVLLLVPISAGGVTWSWGSAQSIAMLVLGAALCLAFVVVEHHHPLPILPLHLFRNRTVALVLGTMFLVGIVWFGQFYIAPLYLQNVLAYSAVQAGALLLPLLIGQAVVMTGVGYAMKRWGHTRSIILGGYAIWTAGQGMQLAWGVRRDLGAILGAMLVQGVGFGLTSQTTLVLAQASCAPQDRAVVTGARNLFRTAGGAAGLAASSALINAVFVQHLPATLPPAVAAQLKTDGFTLDAVPDPLKADVTHAYFTAIRAVFILYTPVIGLCLLLCFFASDAELETRPPPASEGIEMGDRAGEAADDAPTPPLVEPASSTQRVRLDGAAASDDAPSTSMTRKPSRRRLSSRPKDAAKD
ncbi:hypothetical protein Q8F55_005246 [Vanrija albida]|uniref:Major facilitator superfamily (MFS) profile domain-containing protein n=1 Tax=Vanrija albida TaxID=181172 RepID=A0ABR3Q140_9TREE